VRLKEYFVLHVKGDSMNRAGIHEGDYVLLHQQPDAVNNNIVAVEIAGVEPEATLKRYRVMDGGRRVVIQPESDNPVHQPREFTNGENASNGYRILGVVVAVLKRA
jgi:repressor LexA